MAQVLANRFLCRLVFMGSIAMVLPGFSGCYQRKLTPETQFSDADVDLIREQIESFEWE